MKQRGFFYYDEPKLPDALMAEAVGKPRIIAHESAVVAQKQVGNPRVGWFQYQPLWEMIVREQPDLLD